jgi:D-alanyl-lipoteichoic acid acyltransferase DltB (MBOAT superfamily)
MLFNSYTFIFVFLPLTFMVFHILKAKRFDAAMAWLAVASLAFYGWWSLNGLFLLLILMAGNFVFVAALLRARTSPVPIRQSLLLIAITANLTVLGYFKYANFFLENLAALRATEPSLIAVALPLGLSFFTFQKIALLVDAYKGEVQHFNPLSYTLFVSFFPQLIAGPIVHHKEVMPQFAARTEIQVVDVAKGLTLFVIGLAKKVLIADTIAQVSNPIFDRAAGGIVPGLLEAWTGALAYTLQLYFDFSGYSDMALGLALLFGIHLPINFYSPYQAVNIIEFWRRWHITLSRFLRDYLYVPLGGNRRGQLRRYANLGLTMLLGGLWHGAGWTFVVWGALHGVYLTINHAWHAVLLRTETRSRSNIATRLSAQAITFVAVVVAWVLFRATNLDTAWIILRSMSGIGINSTSQGIMSSAVLIPPLLAVVWFGPNSMQIIAHLFPDTPRSYSPPLRWAAAFGAVLAVCLASMTRVTEFLYFQF